MTNDLIALGIWLAGWAIAAIPPFIAKRNEQSVASKLANGPITWQAKYSVTGLITALIGATASFAMPDGPVTVELAIMLFGAGYTIGNGANFWASRGERAAEEPEKVTAVIVAEGRVEDEDGG